MNTRLPAWTIAGLLLAMLIATVEAFADYILSDRASR